MAEKKEMLHGSEIIENDQYTPVELLGICNDLLDTYEKNWPLHQFSGAKVGIEFDEEYGEPQLAIFIYRWETDDEFEKRVKAEEKKTAIKLKVKKLTTLTSASVTVTVATSDGVKF